MAEPKLRTSPWYTQKLKPQEELYCRLLSIDGIAVDTEPFLAGSNISKENLFKLMRAESGYLIPSDAECSVVFFPADTDGSYDYDHVESLYERMDVFATPSDSINRWSPLYGDLLPESFNLYVSAKFGGYAQGETFAVTATEEDVWAWVKAHDPAFKAKALEVTITPNNVDSASVIPFQAKRVTLKVIEPAPVAPEPASVPFNIPKVKGQIPDGTLCELDLLNVNGIELTGVHMGTRMYKDRKIVTSLIHSNLDVRNLNTRVDPKDTGVFNCQIAVRPVGSEYASEMLQVNFVGIGRPLPAGSVTTKIVKNVDGSISNYEEVKNADGSISKVKTVTEADGTVKKYKIEEKIVTFQEPTVTTSAKTSDLIIEGLEMGAVSALIERGARRFLEKTGGDASNPAVLQSAKITTVLLLRHVGLPLMGDKLPNKDFAERRIDMALKGVTTTATHSSLMELMDVMGPMMSLLSQEGPALLGMLGSMDFAAMKEPVVAKSAVG